MAISREGVDPSRTKSHEDAGDEAVPPGCGDLGTILAAQADPHAFEPLYRRYQPQVFGYCLRRLGHPELAADATSQVFINAIKALPRFKIVERRVDSRFRSWLFSIAHNVVIDLYRRHRHLISLDASSASELHAYVSLTDSAPSPEDAALAAELSQALLVHISRLPARQRAVIELRLAGLSRVEIAEALRLSEASVRSAQFRGFATLRQRLSETSSHDQPESSHGHS